MSNQQPKKPEQPKQAVTRQTKPKRRLLKMFIVLLIGLCLLVVFAPKLASTGFVLRQVTGSINDSIAGSVKIESASFSWTGQQVIEKFELLDPAGQTVLALDELVIEKSLLDLLSNSNKLGKVELRNMVGHIVADAQGNTNLQQAIESTATSDSKPSSNDQPTDEKDQPFELPISLELVVKDAQIKVTSPQFDPVHFDKLNVALNAVVGQPIIATINGVTKQGNVTGDILAEIKISGFDQTGVLQRDKATIEAEAKLTNLPVAGIDTLAGLNGALTEVVGQKLNLELTTTSHATSQGDQKISLTVIAKSQRIDTNLTCVIENLNQLTQADQADQTDQTDQVDIEQLLKNLKLTGYAKLIDVPGDSLDRLAKQEGLLALIIGENINLEIKPTTESDRHVIELIVQSPNIHGNINATLHGTNAQLAGQLAMQVSPKLFDTLVVKRLAKSIPNAKAQASASQNTLVQLKLNQVVPIDLTIERVALPLTEFDPSKIAAKVKLSLGDGSIEGDKNVGTYAWKQMRASVNTDNLAESLEIKVTGQTINNQQIGQLVIDANASKLFNDKHQLQFDQIVTKTDIKLTHLPVALADRMGGLDGLLVDALGPVLSVDAIIVATSPKQITGQLSLKSANLTGQIEMTSSDQSINIVSSAGQPVRWLLSSPFLQTVIGKERDIQITNMTSPNKPVAIQLAVNQIQLPLPTEDQPFDFEKVKVHVTVKTDASQITGIKELDRMLVKKLEASIHSDNLSNVRIKANVEIEPGENTLADSITGQTSITLDSQFKVTNETVSAPKITLNIQGQTVQTKLDATLDDNLNLTLPKQTIAKLILTPALFKQLELVKKDQPNIAGPTPVTFIIKPTTIPLKQFSLAKLEATGSLRIDQLKLTENAQVGSVSMSGFKADFTLSGVENKLTATANGLTRVKKGQVDETGSIKADVNLSNWHSDGAPAFAQAKGGVSINIKGVPLALADTLISEPDLLQSTMGQLIDLTATTTLTGQANRAGLAHLTLQSDLLKGSAEFDMTQRLKLTKPAQFKWILTAQGFEALAFYNAPENRKAKPYTLAEPAVLIVTVKQLDWPLSPNKASQAFDLSQTKLVAQVDTLSVKIRDTKTQAVAAIDRVKASIDAPDLSGKITFKMNGDLSYQTHNQATIPQKGQVVVDGTITHLLNKQNALDMSNMVARVDVKMEKLPVKALDQFANAQQRIVALLGEQVNLNAHLELTKGSGPVELTARSDNINLNIKSHLAAGILTFTDDVTASVKVTEKLGKYLLKDINIILESAYSSDKPIALNIPKKGVVIPLKEFDIANVAIPVLQLKMGTIKLKNSGILPLIMKLAKRGDPDNMNVQFTPLVISLRDGQIHYTKRLDLLIDNSTHLATFGEVNLTKQKYDLVLGLPPAFMDKVFNVEGLADDYLFQIPMQSKFSEKPKIDVGKVALEAAALAGSKQDQLIGIGIGIFKQATQKKPDKPVPPLSVNPLPWAKATPEEKPKKEASQKSPSPDDKPKETKKDSQSDTEKVIKDVKDILDLFK